MLNSSSGASSSSSRASCFESFVEGWLAHQHILLDELLKVEKSPQESLEEAEIRDLVTRAMSHFQDYYREKSRMIRRNVFDLFSPTWLAPYERALLWIAGFNPESVFELVFSSVEDLNDGQSEKIDSLMEETEEEERILVEELFKIQATVMMPTMVGLARQEGRRQLLLDGETGEAEAVPIRLITVMEDLVVDADSLRRRVVQEMVEEILSPMQNVRFLAAAAHLRLSIRSVGQQMTGTKPSN